MRDAQTQVHDRIRQLHATIDRLGKRLNKRSLRKRNGKNKYSVLTTTKLGSSAVLIEHAAGKLQLQETVITMGKKTEIPHETCS